MGTGRQVRAGHPVGLDAADRSGLRLLLPHDSVSASGLQREIDVGILPVELDHRALDQDLLAHVERGRAVVSLGCGRSNNAPDGREKQFLGEQGFPSEACNNGISSNYSSHAGVPLLYVVSVN